MALLRGFAGRLLALGMTLGLALVLALPGATALADDRSKLLDRLFAELRTAPDAETAHAIDQQIWRIWIVPPDPELAGRMSAVLNAERNGDLDTAMTLLNRMVVAYPKYAEGWNQRATVEYELNDLAASLADIDRVLAIEPRHFGALSGRAMIYLEEGEHTKALKAMFAALAIHPFLAEMQMFPELSQPAAHA